MKTSSQSPKPHEIAVAIACVIMLIFTVSAIGQRTREHSHQLTCYAQMMTLLHGWTQFAEDHDGELVSQGRSDSWVLDYGPDSLEAKIDSVKDGALFPYVGEVCAYHCPADTRLYDPNQRAFRSYSMSNTMHGSSIRGPIARWVDEIEDPASALVFLEEPDPRHRNIGAWILALDTDEWIDPVATWHEQACNLGFADGHVQRHRWQNQSTLDWGEAAQYADASFSFGLTPEDGLEDYYYIRSVFEIELNLRPEPNQPDDGDGGRR